MNNILKIFCLAVSLFLLAVINPIAETEPDEDAGFLTGKWAYDYETDTIQLELNENGKAVYEGISYDWTIESPFIVLINSKNDEQRIRYFIEGEYIYIYNLQLYSRSENADGILGQWKGIGNKWSFEFTVKGTFLEDGYFPGYYSVDTENGTFTLIYNDHFADTVCYYSIQDNVLAVEYPWRMIRVK